jgi:hypothetical protein
MSGVLAVACGNLSPAFPSKIATGALSTIRRKTSSIEAFLTIKTPDLWISTKNKSFSLKKLTNYYQITVWTKR